VSGIDISEIMIGKARERARRLKLDNIDFRAASALELPFESNSFNVVFAESVTALLPDKNKAMREYIRVTKEGGYIGDLELYLTPDVPLDLLEEVQATLGDALGQLVTASTIDEWKALYEGLGLEEVQVVENQESPRMGGHSTGDMIGEHGFLGIPRLLARTGYHCVVNKQVRETFKKALKAQRMFSVREGNRFIYMGYLLFAGKKPLSA